ncbi:MAG TPA: hypothetical protein VGE20_02760 [Ramlibacter sp.]
MTSYLPQWLNDLNTVLGLVGFVITVVVLIQVASIRRSFRARARLPEIIKELQKTGSTLNGNLEAWPARKNDARAQIKVASSLIQSALPFVQGDVRKHIRDAHSKLAIATRSFDDARYDSPDLAWDLYSDIQLIITSLNQSVRTLNWE